MVVEKIIPEVQKDGILDVVERWTPARRLAISSTPSYNTSPCEVSYALLGSPPPLLPRHGIRRVPTQPELYSGS